MGSPDSTPLTIWEVQTPAINNMGSFFMGLTFKKATTEVLAINGTGCPDTPVINDTGRCRRFSNTNISPKIQSQN